MAEPVKICTGCGKHYGDYWKGRCKLCGSAVEELRDNWLAYSEGTEAAPCAPNNDLYPTQLTFSTT